MLYEVMTLRQVLKTPAGERLTLKFADQAPSVPAGSQSYNFV